MTKLERIIPGSRLIGDGEVEILSSRAYGPDAVEVTWRGPEGLGDRIKELLIRGSLERCLIIAPGSLVEQWQDELSDKFDLVFDILSRDQVETAATGNPFAEKQRLIACLDMLARNDDLQAKLEAAPEWDLIVCDEAHRMSASFFGQEVRYTGRYQLGALAGRLARHFLLMTATPHNGKEEDFQRFMGLLDADRFEGRFREHASPMRCDDRPVGPSARQHRAPAGHRAIPVVTPHGSPEKTRGSPACGYGFGCLRRRRE